MGNPYQDLVSDLQQGMVQEDPHWELARRVASSSGFQAAARQREFLMYVCACAIRNRPEDATEQQIGVHVFGRQPGYSPNDDNVVRSQARLLRLKLEHYFTEQGELEPVVMTIPKGHYLPVFEPRSVHPAPQPVIPSLALPPEPPRRNVSWIVLVALVIGLTATCLWLGTSLRASLRANAPSTSGAFNVFWSKVFQPERRTDIVLSDHTYGMLQEASRHTIPLGVYMGGDYWKIAHDVVEQSGLNKMFADFDHSHLTGLYDVTSVAQMAGLQQYRNALVSTRFARDANIRDLQSDNVVLIGSRHTNPWVERFGSELNFDFDYDYGAMDNYCANRAPRRGEQAQYRPTHSGAERIVYGGVALLPGPHNKGNVLILLGTSLAGNEMACEFITNETLSSRFLERLTRAASGNLPYFEVLLKTVSISGQQATSPEVVAYRTIPN